MQPQAHDVDVKALLRITVWSNIPTASNCSTADFMVTSKLFHENYKSVLNDYSAYMAREVNMSKQQTSSDRILLKYFNNVQGNLIF